MSEVFKILTAITEFTILVVRRCAFSEGHLLRVYASAIAAVFPRLSVRLARTGRIGDHVVSGLYGIRWRRETGSSTPRWLDVSENFIVTLPADGLSTVRVEKVRMTRNALRHIAAAAFRGRVAATLLVIDLSHNQIAHLPAGCWSVG